MEAMERKEPPVQLTTFVLKHANSDVDAGIAQLFHSPALHLAKLVDAAHNHALHALTDNQVGARGRLAVVGTGLKRHIHRGLTQQRLVLSFYRCKGIHLGMPLTTAHMVAFAKNSSFRPIRLVGQNNDSPHHGVWLSVLPSIPCQLQAAVHVFLVYLRIHGLQS